VAGWGEDGALEAVSEFAKTIDGLARRVEDVVHDFRLRPSVRWRRAAFCDVFER
jgi:hypothetical protein